jgi:transcriptional regulator with XRE-family HTH domain
MTNEIISEYERRALNARITITDLCARAGVAGSTFSRWRKGNRPWPQTLQKIDNALDEIEAERIAKEAAA